ncbi:hypothetical protein K9U40_19065 [Xanthobacter autotrophicus]|uniref:hypothetical protein n=1 Tax=Xanthobacter TaxID=279 RepID=UPI0024AA986E|nr:hypothetical protein [Xanthobacter autotrophicus]MDI4666408.1 hypothetical protein [Xanthobacter autotrophicus]
MSVRTLAVALFGATMATATPIAASAQEATLARAPAPPAAVQPEGAYVEECAPPPAMLADRLEMIRRNYTGIRLRLVLAALLSAQETAIGITAEQQEAWRSYTNALLALVPERERVLALLGAADGKDDLRGPEAFGRAEAVADTLIAYATKAQALKAAVANLRDRLSAQQLEAARIPRLQPGIIGREPF